MGVSIVVKGADFSANNIGNAFFPSFESLVGAKFYGNKIPDMIRLKKSKSPGAVFAGDGTITLDDYGLVLGAGQRVASGLSLTPSFTLMLFQEMTLPDNVFRGTAATGLVDGTSGEIKIRNMRSGMDVWSEVMVWPSGQHVLRITAAGVAPTTNVRVTTFLDYNASNLEMHLATVIAGQRTQSALGTAGTAIIPNKPLLLIREATAGASKTHCVAVFDRVLSAAEQMEAHEWVRKFYAANGVDI